MPTLGKWGNSVALRLESHIVAQGQLRPGMTFTMRLTDDGTILVKPVSAKARRRASLNADASESVSEPSVTDKW
jgi:antitoxin component of MazEF toxin-antitoxin module